MAEALLEKCESGSCKVEYVDDRMWLYARFNLFVNAVEADEDLKIIDTTDEHGIQYFVVEDATRDGIQVLVPVDEIIEKCISEKRAEQICDNIKGYGDEGRQVLRGYTRIVGYYTNIHNWNKSKLGEIVDRHKGNYRVDGQFRPQTDLESSGKYIAGIKR